MKMVESLLIDNPENQDSEELIYSDPDERMIIEEDLKQECDILKNIKKIVEATNLRLCKVSEENLKVKENCRCLKESLESEFFFRLDSDPLNDFLKSPETLSEAEILAQELDRIRQKTTDDKEIMVIPTTTDSFSETSINGDSNEVSVLLIVLEDRPKMML
jgi:hypothetical protein